MVSIKQSKFIKSLKIKKYRTKEKCFIVEGRKGVLEGLSANLSLVHLLVTPEFSRDNDESLQNVRDRVQVVAHTDLEALGTFTTNHDCLAVFQMPEDLLAKMPFDDHIIALDGINDPGNLGTIIRTMDWFGLKHLVCSTDTTDAYGPKVINATMGSYTRVKVYYTHLPSFLESASAPAYGADLNGVPLGQWNTPEPVILVMGSESHGLKAEVAAKLKSRVTIGRIGVAESLNVGIATGILCHHLKS